MNIIRLIIKIKAIIASMLYSTGSNTGKFGSFTILKKKIRVAIINVTIVVAMAMVAIILADIELKDLRVFNIFN